jgi:hypothetical protein
MDQMYIDANLDARPSEIFGLLLSVPGWFLFYTLIALVTSTLYIMWMCNDNEKTRGRLWWIMAINLASLFVNFITVFVYGV